MPANNRVWKVLFIGYSSKELMTKTSRVRAVTFLLIPWLALSAYAKPKSVRHIDTSRGGLNLHIPDVAWDHEKADFEVGWCGEASIQMALAYYGKKIPQDVIHQAGKPRQADLQGDDMDRALQNTGALFVPYSGKPNDLEGFIAWIKKELRLGHPVICGCKIYPTENPEWDVDHFVVASGYNSKGLLLNTQLDCDGQLLVRYKQLISKKAGYSFRNPRNVFWARAITGIR